MGCGRLRGMEGAGGLLEGGKLDGGLRVSGLSWCAAGGEVPVW